MDLVSGLGYGGIKRACRHPERTFDQVLTVRETRERVEGMKEVRRRIANCKFTQIKQLNRKS